MTKSSRKDLPKPLAYTISIPFDRRLFRHDIAGSMAHARMLGKQGIISETEARAICDGLKSIQEEIEGGAFPFKDELEDIHMNIEARLHDVIGDVAGKLHTARSRNDQIALDMRLFVKEAIEGAVKGLQRFQEALLEQAGTGIDIIMPGYTHLQRAQPVLLAHHLLAYFEMAQRDVERFRDCRKRTDVLPLGSGALAGVTYPIDRESVARDLGFARVGRNSMDSVSDRDFVVEYHSAACITMLHLSRLSEELIIWSSEEFGFVTLDPDYTTGSSIMPQKRNPDVAELARGKTGRVYGNLVSLLTTLKALPLAYNKDLQEDKEGLFDTVDTLSATLEVMAGMVRTMKVEGDKTRAAAEAGIYSGILATDLADYLASRGLSFRQAHKAVKELVDYAADRGLALNKLTIEDYKRFSPLFEDDVFSITVESSIAARNTPGGTAPEQVRRALSAAREMLRAGNG